MSTSTIIVVQAVAIFPADKWGMTTCLNIPRSVNSCALILEGWEYKNDVSKQLMLPANLWDTIMLVVSHNIVALSQPTKTNLHLKTSTHSFWEEINPRVVMLMNLDLFRAWIKSGSKKRIERSGVAFLAAFFLSQVSLSKGRGNLQHVPGRTLKHWDLFAVCLMRLWLSPCSS